MEYPITLHARYFGEFATEPDVPFDPEHPRQGDWVKDVKGNLFYCSSVRPSIWDPYVIGTDPYDLK